MKRGSFRILVLVQDELVPPETTEGLTDKEIAPWKMEYDVITQLKYLGHAVQTVGSSSDLAAVQQALEGFKPHVAFNLVEEVHGRPLYDQHLVSFLELLRQPYTGCGPRGLTIARDKAFTKAIAAAYRIRTPKFWVFPLGRKVRRPRRLHFPLMVKSVHDDGSLGISQASVVHDDTKLSERVEFIHRQTWSPAIAEEYIEGREIYVGVMGNQRLETFTPWELLIKRLPDGAPLIATDNIKWNVAYQERVGVTTQAADIAPAMARKLSATSKQVYRILGLSGYARLDFRVSADGRAYLLEANPNPNLSYGEDFAEAAEHSGLPYDALLSKILKLGINYGREHWKA